VATATAQQTELVQAYADATVRLRASLIQVVGSMWTELGSWREEDAVTFLRQVLPLVDGASSAMASLTDAYLTQLIADMTGTVPTTGFVEPAYARPVPMSTVYRRPFVDMWTALSKGANLIDAVAIGKGRLVNIAATDLQLAKRNASQQRLAGETRVVGYRRVLTGSKSCAMCALAASQRYHKSRLMPIHPGCNCAVAPIVGTADPGRKVNVHVTEDASSLEAGDVRELPGSDALHRSIASRFGADAVDLGGRTTDYRQLVVVHEHGELGPVMARKGDSFTSAADLP
jgi:hypothetical protein